MKILFKLTNKRKVATSLLEYNCSYYLIQILPVNITAFNIMAHVDSFSTLDISINTNLK